MRFRRDVRPLIERYCFRCHNPDNLQSGIRLDELDGRLAGRRIFLWKAILEQLSDEAMPPADEPQLKAEERQMLITWIEEAIAAAQSRMRDKNGSVRRLTVAQYRHTLRDLLGLDDDLAIVLPPDAVSADGFLNNAESLQLSPLLMETYYEIAERALARCLVDPASTPVIQHFQVDLGAHINPEPCPDTLVLGALSHLLENDDFLVTELAPDKPFAYTPFRMRTKFRYIEGYQGNDTVRFWKDFDSIYHAVFACMRGTDGYPKGLAYETVPEGLLLRPAIPSAELFQVESTYGPRANFKISLRELPDHGRFRVTVRAAKYSDGLLLDPGDSSQPVDTEAAIHIEDCSQPRTLTIAQAGVYQVDVHTDKVESEQPPVFRLQLGERHFAGQLTQPAFLVVHLDAGPLQVSAAYSDQPAAGRLVFTPLPAGHVLADRFARFERRLPRVGVHLGLRRDCGSTLAQVGSPQPVDSTELRDYVFEGAISNFPSPDVEKNNVNYLAGIREIGIRSEYTDGRDMPRLVIRSVQFEGPLYESWPPATHRNIFIASENPEDRPAYARAIIRSFASRAFRRPATESEQAALLAVWQRAMDQGRSFQQSVQDALLVVLVSPQFLLLTEASDGPQAEPLAPHELASKLSYFLWNTAPDARLLELAASNQIHSALDSELERMIADPRFEQFIDAFVAQWLSLDKLDVVEVDRDRFPRLTRDVKRELREEPMALVKHLIRENLPLRHLIDSEFLMANEVVASYYDLGEKTESGFTFVPIAHGSKHLGGLLSQAGILAGLSDGREANPIKRGAWLARKIIAEPPDDPPPNVPALPKNEEVELTLRERLEQHRNQQGCAKCHSGIDPWGLPLQQYDAGGRFLVGTDVDARSKLPDDTQVAGAGELKAHLAGDRLDQVAFSVYKHLATYAVGRTLTYNEIEFLREKGLELKPQGYPLRDMIRLIVQSGIFLEK